MTAVNVSDNSATMFVPPLVSSLSLGGVVAGIGALCRAGNSSEP